jgi:flagellar biogenesis protein FliO
MTTQNQTTIEVTPVGRGMSQTEAAEFANDAVSFCVLAAFIVFLVWVVK